MPEAFYVSCDPQKQLPGAVGPAQPLSAGRASFRASLPHLGGAVYQGRGGPGGAASHQALQRGRRGKDLEEARRRIAKDSRRPGIQRDAARHGNERRTDLCAASAHGRVLRVLHDAHGQRIRPEAAGRALLPVPERGRGFREEPLCRGRDPDRPRVCERESHCRGQHADGDGLRAGQRGDPHGLAHGRGLLLLPSQDAAPGQGLRRPHGHLHDLQRHGPVAHQARHRAPGGRQGRHGSAATRPWSTTSSSSARTCRARWPSSATAADAAARP